MPEKLSTSVFVFEIVSLGNLVPQIYKISIYTLELKNSILFAFFTKIFSSKNYSLKLMKKSYITLFHIKMNITSANDLGPLK
jgi:hypothetical protein